MWSSSWIRFLLAITLLAIPAMAAALGQSSEYYIPHVANGEIGASRFANTLYILDNNPDYSITNVQIDCFRDDGSPWTIQIMGNVINGTTSSFYFTLGNSAAYALTSGWGPLETGWFRIRSNRPIWITSTYVFMDWNYNPIWEAGILPAKAFRKLSFCAPVTPHPILGDNLNTALAIANPNAAEANVTARLYKAGLSPMSTKTLEIPPQGHFAQFLSELFGITDDLDGEQFWVEFEADVPIAVVGLLARYDMSVFSSISLEPSDWQYFNTIDDLSGNTTHNVARALDPPVEVRGAIQNSQDFFAVDLTAGKDLNVLVVARQLGSTLNPSVTLNDKFGASIAFNDNMGDNCQDAFLSYHVTTSDTYYIRVAGSTGTIGGPSAFYRLHVSVK
jgi:hypothetical protein